MKINKIPRILKYSDIGSNQFGRVYNKIGPIVAVATFLKLYGISFTKFQMIGLIIFSIISSVIIGLVWVKIGLLRAELDVDQKQSPIYLKLCDVERKLDAKV